MMATEFCPECHQRLSELVAGIRLPRFKARLYRFIESHPGQLSGELAQHFYNHSSAAGVIRAHIYQINDALMNTPVRIRGFQHWGYRIEKGSRIDA